MVKSARMLQLGFQPNTRHAFTLWTFLHSMHLFPFALTSLGGEQEFGTAKLFQCNVTCGRTMGGCHYRLSSCYMYTAQLCSAVAYELSCEFGFYICKQSLERLLFMKQYDRHELLKETPVLFSCPWLKQLPWVQQVTSFVLKCLCFTLMSLQYSREKTKETFGVNKAVWNRQDVCWWKCGITGHKMPPSSAVLLNNCD